MTSPSNSTPLSRHSTGIPALDQMMGGGLIPGTLTVIVGATGIGKTQLGLQYANAGRKQEGRGGVVFDMSARGDSQSHADYARRMFDRELKENDAQEELDLEHFYNPQRNFGDYQHVFEYRGQRVTRRDLEWEAWQEWQAQLNTKLRNSIAFLYGNFIQGVRRTVIDGIEPTDRPSDSIQFNLFEYVYQQILRKDPEWVARDLFRERYRQNAEHAAKHLYDPRQVSCVLLSTSHETMLDDLISRPLHEGDAISNANTLIMMGKVRTGDRIGRGIYIAKHRGSACEERIIPYHIENSGIVID